MELKESKYEYQNVAYMRLAELNLKLAFPSYWKAQTEALSVDRISKDELIRLQNNRLLQLLAHARTHSKFYTDLPMIAGVSEIEKLPLLTKDLIRKNVESIKASNYSTDELAKNSTSGSSGDALHFYSDAKLDPMRQAIAMRGNYWAGYTFGDPLLLLWGSVADVNKAKELKKRLAHSPLLFNQKILSSFEMKDDDMAGHLKVMNKFKPSVIVGYPSSLDVFSDFLIRHKESVHAPNGIITSGETLFQPQRERIEKAFGCKVMNRYGSREMGNIASECLHQKGLHVHEDHVVVEILNENQQPCLPGELGEIVVTDLNNFGFPMIRYRIGDLGVLSDKACSCGRPFRLLERVEGRVFDLIVGPNGNNVPGNYFTLYLRKLPGIDQFQVKQNKQLEMEVLLVVNAQYTTETQNKLMAGLKEKLGSTLQVSVSIVDHISPTASGKHRWVISEASPFIQV